MRETRVAQAIAALAAVGLTASCGTAARSGGASAVAPASSSTPASSPGGPPPPASSPSSPAAALPPIETVPLVLIHGINSKPGDFATIVSALAPGRRAIPELYALEADALPAGSLPADLVVAFGYYKESASGPVTQDASIGGCPVPRTDGAASLYRASYAERVRRGVEGIRRATGAPRVDLVLHSMGGVVGRAYTKWLSVDASGRSAVRRIFTIGSPARGVNALEATVTAFSETGPIAYMRRGECLELCGEADLWGGRSFIAQLNDGWDAFCRAHDVRYAGMAMTGERGVPAGKNPTAPNGVTPSNPLPGGGYLTGRDWAMSSFFAALGTFTPTDLLELTLLPRALGDVARETAEALGPGDGVVRLASARLDQPPFADAAFFGTYEGAHANLPDPERGFASTWVTECVRAFCLDSALPQDAVCRSIELRAAKAPGHATWLFANVDVTGRGAMAIQLVEEPLDARGEPIYGLGYAAPLRPGAQRVPFLVVKGGGTRRYRLVAYGPRGPIGMVTDAVVTLEDGAPTSAPRATVAAPATTATPAGPVASFALGSNAAPGDATVAYRVRLDAGDWSAWSSDATFTTPPLGAGAHRIEVVARHASNAADVLVEQGAPTVLGLRVDVAGGVTVVR